jgi:hypothetical protein
METGQNGQLLENAARLVEMALKPTQETVLIPFHSLKANHVLVA